MLGPSAKDSRGRAANKTPFCFFCHVAGWGWGCLSDSQVISGHVHAYQRSHPVYKGEVAADGSKAPVYVVLGDGGNREGHALGYATPQPAWSAYKNDTQFG